MASSTESYLQESSQTERTTKVLDDVVDYTVTKLEKCMQSYKEKIKKNESTLEKLGCSVDSIPENLRKELREIFKDSDVWSMQSNGGITLNPRHVLDSLQSRDEVAVLQRTNTQLGALHSRFQQTHYNIQQKLDLEAAEADGLDEQIHNIKAKGVKVKAQLAKSQLELADLQQTAQSMNKPKYSLSELQSLLEEENHLGSEIQITQVHLAKYYDLPLSEKGAAKKLVELQQQLAIVNNEIKNAMDPW